VASSGKPELPCGNRDVAEAAEQDRHVECDVMVEVQIGHAPLRGGRYVCCQAGVDEWLVSAVVGQCGLDRLQRNLVGSCHLCRLYCDRAHQSMKRSPL